MLRSLLTLLAVLVAGDAAAAKATLIKRVSANKAAHAIARLHLSPEVQSFVAQRLAAAVSKTQAGSDSRLSLWGSSRVHNIAFARDADTPILEIAVSKRNDGSSGLVVTDNTISRGQGLGDNRMSGYVFDALGKVKRVNVSDAGRWRK